MLTSALIGDVKTELRENAAAGSEREWTLAELLLYTRWGVSVVWRLLSDELPQVITQDTAIGVPAGLRSVFAPDRTLRFLGIGVESVDEDLVPPSTEFAGAWSIGPSLSSARLLAVPVGEPDVWLSTDGSFYGLSSGEWSVVSPPAWISAAMASYAAWWGEPLSYFECDESLEIVDWRSLSGNKASFFGTGQLRFGESADSDRKMGCLYIPCAPQPIYDPETSTDDDIPIPDDYMWMVREGVVMRCLNRTEALPQLEAKFENELRGQVTRHLEKRMPLLLQAVGPW